MIFLKCFTGQTVGGAVVAEGEGEQEPIGMLFYLSILLFVLFCNVECSLVPFAHFFCFDMFYLLRYVCFYVYEVLFLWVSFFTPGAVSSASNIINIVERKQGGYDNGAIATTPRTTNFNYDFGGKKRKNRRRIDTSSNTNNRN